MDGAVVVVLYGRVKEESLAAFSLKTARHDPLRMCIVEVCVPILIGSK
jgi:hypothetical protein